MTSDNIAEYVGENNQFTEKPVTEYPPVIQDNTVTTKDYLYSNNIDTDLLVVIGGLIVILFLMMLIMYFINSLRHKELTEILTKISFPEKSGSNSLKPEAVSCNLLSLCVLAPVFFTPRNTHCRVRFRVPSWITDLVLDPEQVVYPDLFPGSI